VLRADGVAPNGAEATRAACWGSGSGSTRKPPASDVPLADLGAACSLVQPGSGWETARANQVSCLLAVLRLFKDPLPAQDPDSCCAWMAPSWPRASPTATAFAR